MTYNVGRWLSGKRATKVKSKIVETVITKNLTFKQNIVSAGFYFEWPEKSNLYLKWEKLKGTNLTLDVNGLSDFIVLTMGTSELQIPYSLRQGSKNILTLTSNLSEDLEICEPVYAQLSRLLLKIS